MRWRTGAIAATALVVTACVPTVHIETYYIPPSVKDLPPKETVSLQVWGDSRTGFLRIRIDGVPIETPWHVSFVNLLPGEHRVDNKATETVRGNKARETIRGDLPDGVSATVKFQGYATSTFTLERRTMYKLTVSENGEQKLEATPIVAGAEHLPEPVAVPMRGPTYTLHPP